jgi:citrate synthase
LQSKNVHRGLLITGVTAAVFSDLGFQPKAGGSLFQLLGSPGLVAHGLEMSGKPLLAMPFVKDENYFIENMSNSNVSHLNSPASE